MHTDTIPAHLTMSTPAEVVADALRHAGPEAEIEIVGRADGYVWSVRLLPPSPHPDHGADIPARPVRVQVTIGIDAEFDDDGDPSVRCDLQTEAVVLGQMLHALWGRRDGSRFYRRQWFGGDTLTHAVGRALAVLRLEHDAAVDRVNARAMAIAAEDARYAEALAR